MASELAKTATALVGVILVGASVAVGWSTLEPLEDPVRVQPSEEEYSGVRVFFETVETRLVMKERELPADQQIRFDPLMVPLYNVTWVTVTLHTHVEGVALNDQYEVVVRSPDGGVKEGVWNGPLVNMDGYRSSVVVVSDWQRAAQPLETTYDTLDSEEALGWSAENHTRSGSRGPWEAEISMTTPGLNRSGNVTLSFTFVHYSALAVLDRPSEPRECPQEDAAVEDCAFAPEGEDRPDSNTSAHREGAPRTFITRGGLAQSVDRDPGPHGPL